LGGWGPSTTPGTPPPFKDVRHGQVGLLSERGNPPIPAITARPSLFARSSARWHVGPIARTLASFSPSGALRDPIRGPQGPWMGSSRTPNGGGSRRVYPVQDATRGAMKPPVPLGPYSTPGECMPEWHGHSQKPCPSPTMGHRQGSHGLFSRGLTYVGSLPLAVGTQPRGPPAARAGRRHLHCPSGFTPPRHQGRVPT